mmetsp:Transcript_16920/g.21410  ORF Transcript_16920/g.21410 Transcript_16920/m.21410 type:complete len:399 (+) Transcript_16920:129-1325(+)
MRRIIDSAAPSLKTTSAAAVAVSISLAVSTIASAVAVFITKKRIQKETTKQIDQLQELREAERRGRIKAEILLRTTIKNEEEKRISASSAFYSSASSNKDNGDKGVNSKEKEKTSKEENDRNHNMMLRCVGHVVSPFVKRMGTPRQGALAPHARGYIQMNQTVAPMETLSGIASYSHAWIIFCFHANTDCQSLSVKTKVKPPRAPYKVGSMATRSPHRPNPIGLSLVKILGVDEKRKRLYIAALDLVNGTPVYDIKPCVPWDIPGHFDGESLSVPDWVSQEDALSEVSFTVEAERNLKNLVEDGALEPLYEAKQYGFENVKEAIKEVLSQDPRAAKRRGKVDNSKSCDPYKISFSSTQIEFLVQDDRCVNVVKIDKTVVHNKTLFVDGIPLAQGGIMS